MRLDRDAFSIQAAIEKGRALPDWYLDEPVVMPADEFYLRAFYELNTGRPNSGMGPVPISWRDILEYAEYAGLERGIWPDFKAIIRTLDTAFMRWLNGEKARHKNIADTTSPPRDTRQRRP